MATASLPATAIRRVRSAVGNTTGRELLAAALLAAVIVALLFGTHIRHGGFESDDWSLFVDTKFPAVTGHSDSIAALAAAAGSRIGATLYWLAMFSLFGTHAKLYLTTAALITVAMVVSFYAALRVLGFSRVESGAMMIIAIAMPVVDTTRLWIITAGGQLCFAFFFLGLAVALRAFDAPPPRRLRLHLLSLVLYVASAAYAEIAMPLVAIAVLVYMTRTSIVRSAKRWLADLVIVAACYAGTVIFVNTTVGFTKAPVSQWWSRAELIYGQAMTIFSAMVVPFANGSHAVLFGLLAVLVALGSLIWRRSATSSSTRGALRRWGVTLAIAVVAAAVGWGTYIPSSYYLPLGEGIGSRINIVADAPVAAAVFAVIMLAKTIFGELVFAVSSNRSPLNRRNAFSVAAIVAFAWFAYVAVDGALDVRRDASLWTLSASDQYRILGLLKYEIPHPVHDSEIDTFGAPGMDAPGLPIFLQSWELNSAVKIAYDRPDLTGFPVLAGLSSVACEAHAVGIDVGSTPEALPSPYGHTYFVNTTTGAAELIRSRASCLAAVTVFPPGPYILAAGNWSL